MKLTLFGASGKIGGILMDIALNHGDDVTVYVRNPEKIPKRANLEIVAGQLSDTTLIEIAVKKSDVIISALGPVLDTTRKPMGTPIADGHEMIIQAMKNHGKKRLITLATPSARSDDDTLNFYTIFPPFMARLAFPNAYNDMKSIGHIVKNSSLDWTVVRIIYLVENINNAGYAISVDGTNSKMAVSRENVASFMYDVAANNRYIHKMPIIFNAGPTHSY